MRICKECGRSQPLDLFIRNRRSRDGLALMCNPCRSAQADARRQARHDMGYTPRIPKTRRSKYLQRREAVLTQLKLAYAANPEKYKSRTQAWQRANPHYLTARNAKRRATLLQRTPHWLSPDDLCLICEFYETARNLSELTGQPFQVDHIVPLQGRLVSGLHVPWNLQILSASENAHKNNSWEI